MPKISTKYYRRAKACTNISINLIKSDFVQFLNKNNDINKEFITTPCIDGHIELDNDFNIEIDNIDNNIDNNISDNIDNNIDDIENFDSDNDESDNNNDSSNENTLNNDELISNKNFNNTANLC